MTHLKTFKSLFSSLDESAFLNESLESVISTNYWHNDAVEIISDCRAKLVLMLKESVFEKTVRLFQDFTFQLLYLSQRQHECRSACDHTCG